MKRSLPIKLHLVKIVSIMIIIVIIFILEPYKLRLESVQEWFNHHLKYTKNYQQEINISNIPKYTKNYQQEINISNIPKYTKNYQQEVNISCIPKYTKNYHQVVNKTVANKSDANEDILETKEAEKLDIVKQVDDWGNRMRFAQWQHPSEVDKNFSEDWVTLLQTFLEPGCNIVDIGAHGGDTTIPLAVASRGGTVVAVEMGPPYDLLTINARLNPQLHIHVYRKAVSNKEGFVYYQSGCNGCNGGISSTGHTGTKVESVRLSTASTRTPSSETSALSRSTRRAMTPSSWTTLRTCPQPSCGWSGSRASGWALLVPAAKDPGRYSTRQPGEDMSSLGRLCRCRRSPHVRTNTIKGICS